MLVGRESERSALRDVLATVATGRGAGLAIVGEAGTGKSALVAEACADATARGLTVLRATARERERTVAYSSLGSMVAPVQDSVAGLGRSARAALAAVVGLKGASADSTSVRLSFLELVLGLAAEAPVLVVLDDAQWSDLETLDVVAFTADRVQADAVALVVAARALPEVLHGAELRTVRLEALDPGALATIVDADGPIDPEVRARCVALADGNPLAALEYRRALTTAQREGLEPVPLVPKVASAAERACSHRLAGADDKVRRALVVVAADTTGEAQVVRRALSALSEPEGALDDAEAAGLVTLDGGTIAIAHPLLRSLAYHDVAPASRRAAHRALALALDRPDDAEARAWQLAAAASGPDEPTAAALDLVARRARARGAPSAAASASQRAALLSPSDGARAGRLADAARWWLEAGDTARARDVAERLLASSTGDHVLVGASVAALALRWTDGPRSAASRILAVTEGAEPDVAATLRAIAADELLAAGEVGRAARVDADLELLDDDPATRDRAALLAASAHLATGDLDAAVRTLDGAFDAAAWPGPMAPAAAAVRAACLLRAGDLVGAYASSDAAVLLGRGAPTVLPCELVAARCEALLGSVDASRERVARVVEVAGRLGLGPALVEAHEILALAAMAEGNAGDAVDDLRRAFRAASAWAWPREQCDFGVELVEALLAAGAGAEAAVEAAALRAGPGPWATGRVARAVGAATGDAAKLSAAIRTLEPFPFERARAQLAAAVLPTAGAKGGELGAAAASTFAAIGAVPWAQRARSLGPSQAGPLSGLSTAELRVALEVGKGSSNREAAEALFLSVKTVDFHLQGIYRKLAIRSRAELAAMVGRAASAEGAR